MSKFMRMLVFFDIPVKTKREKRIATAFRNFLLKDGYHMVQYRFMLVSATAWMQYKNIAAD